MNAFLFLSSGRIVQLGFGAARPNPIPMTEIAEYHRVFCAPFPVDTFAEVIRRFDMEYISEEVERMNRDSKQKTPPKAPKAGRRAK